MEEKMYTYVKLTCDKILVIFQTWERPNDYWNEIAEDLRKESSDAEVFFDFLMNNGLKDRFYAAKFQKGKLIFSSFRKISLDASYVKIANSFFARNKGLIDNSVMPRLQKTLFKRQIAPLS
jgi:hypothetical protein